MANFTTINPNQIDRLARAINNGSSGDSIDISNELINIANSISNLKSYPNYIENGVIGVCNGFKVKRRTIEFTVPDNTITSTQNQYDYNTEIPFDILSVNNFYKEYITQSDSHVSIPYLTPSLYITLYITKLSTNNINLRLFTNITAMNNRKVRTVFEYISTELAD